MTGLIDPELVGPLEAFVATYHGGIDLHDIPAFRAMSKEMNLTAAAQAPAIEGVTSTDRRVPGPARTSDDTVREVPVRVYQPAGRPVLLPAILWIHGGGYVIGSMEEDDLYAKGLAKAAGCVVVSVDYRLAPEHRFPAPVEDCYAALKWLAARAAELGVDPRRIAIAGASAGGGLAAGLALLTRDRAEVRPAFQLLIYPMIDDANVAQAGPSLADSLLWTREDNLIGWRSYLGGEPGGKDVSPYAAAMRATELKGLPPAYIAVGALDLFLLENIKYAHRLIEAGVPVELHVYPGGYHGFDGIAPDAAVSQRFTADKIQVLKRALQS